MGNARQAIVYLAMRLIGAAREDDPFVWVAHKAFLGDGPREGFVLHIEKRRSMVDARGGPHDNRRGIALGKLKGLLHHLKRLLGGGRVEHRHLGKSRIAARVLLGLGRYGAGIVGYKQNQAALYAHVVKAHQRVGGNV